MMSEVIRQETVVFFLSVLHGAVLTLAYDVLRALRRSFRHSSAAVSAEDFLFWLIAGFLTFCLAFFWTDGVIRGYVAAGIVIGAVLYHFSLSELVVRGLSAIFRGAGRIVRWMGRTLSKPLKKICYFFKKIIEFVRKKVYNKKRENASKKLVRGKSYGRKKKAAKQEQPQGNGCDCGGGYGIACGSACAEPEVKRPERKV